MNPLLPHLPNLLTALRLCAAPLTAYLILHGRDGGALAVFAFAGLSDALDGYLARRLAPDSRFGAYLDPAADKLLMLASFATLAVMQAVPFWLAALVIGRDVAIVFCVFLSWMLAVPLRIAPLAVGKISTVVQVAFIGVILMLRAFDVEVAGAAQIAAAATGAVTVASWLAYGQVWFRAMALGRRPA